ncbi:hypothetical protein V493_00641, partial [Pseudogymnoascus sp. VKM F-4281 (FW-2241)]
MDHSSLFLGTDEKDILCGPMDFESAESYPVDPRDVVCLARGWESGGVQLFLDVRRGEMIEDEVRCDTKRAVDVVVFFERFKEMYRSLKLIPCAIYEMMVIDQRDDPEAEGKEDGEEVSTEVMLRQTESWDTEMDVRWLRGLYRRLGWPDNFQRVEAERQDLCVGNKYRIGRKIGSGGFGEIYQKRLKRKISELSDITQRVLGIFFPRGIKSSESWGLEIRQRAHRHVAVKIFTNDGQDTDEIAIYKHISRGNKSRVGYRYVRTALDSFELMTRGGKHPCLVHEPLWDSIRTLLERSGRDRLTEDLLRVNLQRLLLALDYLHTDRKLIHTDIKSDNILHLIEDTSILAAFEEAEIAQPSPRKKA